MRRLWWGTERNTARKGQGRSWHGGGAVHCACTVPAAATRHIGIVAVGTHRKGPGFAFCTGRGNNPLQTLHSISIPLMSETLSFMVSGRRFEPNHSFSTHGEDDVFSTRAGSCSPSPWAAKHDVVHLCTALLVLRASSEQGSEGEWHRKGGERAANRGGRGNGT